MPYFAGLNSALWMPIQPSTINGRMPPAGLLQRAAAAAAIKSTSTDFIMMMTVRLLTRSARTPATIETKASGRVKTIKARAVWVCAAVSNSGPGAMVPASCRMASRATISFQALSLKAPMNWAMRRPRSGWDVAEGPVLIGVVTLCLRRYGPVGFPGLATPPAA